MAEKVAKLVSQFPAEKLNIEFVKELRGMPESVAKIALKYATQVVITKIIKYIASTICILYTITVTSTKFLEWFI